MVNRSSDPTVLRLAKQFGTRGRIALSGVNLRDLFTPLRVPVGGPKCQSLIWSWRVYARRCGKSQDL